MLRTLFLLAFASVPIWADELSSGPETGASVPALSVHVAAGPGAGAARDVAAERVDQATIFAFVQAAEFDRPMARLLKTIDDAITREGTPAPGAALVAVWLTDEPEKSKDYLPRAQQSLQTKATSWSVFDGPRQGPEAWSINDSAGITFVVARAGKVLVSRGFDSWEEADARKILRPLLAP